MNPELIRIDVRIAWEFASCYGVNLAVSVAVFFSQAVKPCRFQNSGFVPLSKQRLGAAFKTVASCRFQNSGFVPLSKQRLGAAFKTAASSELTWKIP
jgi:hypothetical protein